METTSVPNADLRAQIDQLRAQLASTEAELARTRTESRQSEVHFRALFEHSHDCVLMVEPTLDRIVEANDKACRMLGYSREELIAMPFSAIHKDDRVELERFAKGVIQRGHGFTDQLHCRTKSGHKLMSEVSASVLQECGDCTRFLVSVRNVTEHKQVESALEQTESLFQAVVQSAPIAIVIGDAHGNIQLVNDAFTAMFGYTDEDIRAGMHFGQLGKHAMPSEARAPEMLQKLYDGKIDSINLKKCFVRKDGRSGWAHSTMFTIRDKHGQVQNLIALIKDVTEWKKAEEALRRQARILENTSDFVGIASMDGFATYVNPAGMAMIGRAGESVENLCTDEFMPTDASRMLEEVIVPQLLERGGVWQGELDFVHRDGHRIPTTQAMMLVHSMEGEPVGVASIARDVTEVKRFERALHEARDRAEAANRAKSAFLASMSHELRTPLNAILGFSQLMSRDRGLTSDQQDNLRIINRSGEHLLSLINDVLEMSKIEAGRTTVNEASFALHRLLGDLEDMFRLRAESKNLSLLFEREDDVPEYVYSDEGKLRQILINLVGNAIKFTDEGGVTLRIGFRDTGGTPMLHFEVEDTGQGIAEEELEHLFDAFVQTRSGHDAQEGTGLGIPISREFARMLDGDLTVKSQVGVGSTFAFQVRARATDSCDSMPQKDTRRVIGLEPGQDAYRILVVEDREENRRLLTRLLRPLGFEVREAVNGAEAIEMWHQFAPHLIWMDMRMPVMDGYEATQRIRATTRGQATVIIAITASAFEEDRNVILSAGCDDFVRKPFRENDVYDKMAEHLGVRFVYDMPVDEERAEAAQPESDMRIAALPAAVRERLQKATLEADFDAMFAAIEELRAHDSESATALAELANGFRYDEILGLLEQPRQG